MSTVPPPDISVIVFAADQGHLLRGTLLSVERAVAAARRSGLAVDVSVAVVGEDARTRDWLSEHSPHEASQFASQSLGQARNAALVATRGRAVAFIDGWDAWSADFLVAGRRRIQTETAPTVWRPAALLGFADDVTDLSQVSLAFTPSPGMMNGGAILLGNPYPTSFIAGRAVLERVPFPLEDEARGWSDIDWWWCANIIGNGIENRPIEDTVLYFRASARLATAAGARRFGPTQIERRTPLSTNE